MALVERLPRVDEVALLCEVLLLLMVVGLLFAVFLLPNCSRFKFLEFEGLHLDRLGLDPIRVARPLEHGPQLWQSTRTPTQQSLEPSGIQITLVKHS